MSPKGAAKLLHGSHRTFRRQDHTRNRSGSSAHVSPKARQIAPRESSHLSSSRSQQQKPERLLCTRVSKGAANCSTGVIAPFVVKITPETGGGSSAHVSPKARQIAPRESSRNSSSRPHQKPKRLHCTRVSHGAANCSTGVMTPFIVQTTPEAKAAPLHSCLPWRGK